MQLPSLVIECILSFLKYKNYHILLLTSIDIKDILIFSKFYRRGDFYYNSRLITQFQCKKKEILKNKKSHGPIPQICYTGKYKEIKFIFETFNIIYEDIVDENLFSFEVDIFRWCVRHIICKHGALKVFKYLCERIRLNEKDMIFALRIAIGVNRTDVVKYIINNYIKSERRIHIIRKTQYYLSRSKFETIKCIFKNKFIKYSEIDDTMLNLFIIWSDIKTIKYLLHGLNVHYMPKKYKTVLMWSLKCISGRVIKYFIKKFEWKEEDFKYKNNEFLIGAIIGNNMNVVKWLCKHNQYTKIEIENVISHLCKITRDRSVGNNILKYLHIKYCR